MNDCMKCPVKAMCTRSPSRWMRKWVKAEEVVSGKHLPLDMATVETADTAVSDARPLGYNKWKIPIAKAIVKQLLMAVAT